MEHGESPGDAGAPGFAPGTIRLAINSPLEQTLEPNGLAQTACRGSRHNPLGKEVTYHYRQFRRRSETEPEHDLMPAPKRNLTALLLSAILCAICVDPLRSQTSSNPPLSPRDEQGTFRLAKGFKIELVAAEPEVIDPVAMCFDEDGRLFVVEMRGYPNAG